MKTFKVIALGAMIGVISSSGFCSKQPRLDDDADLYPGKWKRAMNRAPGPDDGAAMPMDESDSEDMDVVVENLTDRTGAVSLN